MARRGLSSRALSSAPLEQGIQVQLLILLGTDAQQTGKAAWLWREAGRGQFRAALSLFT